MQVFPPEADPPSAETCIARLGNIDLHFVGQTSVCQNTTREERSMKFVPAMGGQVPAIGGSASGGKTCPTVMPWFYFARFGNIDLLM